MNPVKYTRLFKKNLLAFNSGVRRIVNKGGTSSSKTVSTLQLLLEIAIDRQASGVLISVISETLPHLKLGAIRDFDSILRAMGFVEGEQYKHANHVYTFGSSVIEFFSADSGKATGPRRDIAYLNECINIPYEIVTEIEQRTRQCIFYDFNPVEVFWIEDRVLSLPASEFILIKSNYLDNDQLDESIRKEIELKASRDQNYKRIHVDVEYGIYEGLVFPEWKQVEAIPENVRSVFAMDFGFTNDPTTLIEIADASGAWWIDELLFQTGMTNADIAGFLRSVPVGRKAIVADSSEPKSIEELSRAGFNISGADKGPDSIRAGIDRLKSREIFVTKRSTNLIRELRNYRYKIDRNGISTNEPIDMFNHLIDPSRYGSGYLSNTRAFSTGGYRVRNV